MGSLKVLNSERLAAGVQVTRSGPFSRPTLVFTAAVCISFGGGGCLHLVFTANSRHPRPKRPSAGTNSTEKREREGSVGGGSAARGFQALTRHRQVTRPSPSPGAISFSKIGMWFGNVSPIFNPKLQNQITYTTQCHCRNQKNYPFDLKPPWFRYDVAVVLAELAATLYS